MTVIKKSIFRKIIDSYLSKYKVQDLALTILDSEKIHPSYNMTDEKKIELAERMWKNYHSIETGVAIHIHLAMALKILETPPEIKGDVVECGTWKGGTAANLSLVCEIVNRKLLVYDSFEGLPGEIEGDRESVNYQKGDYCGSYEDVKKNISKYGYINRCKLIKGWFDDTLPSLNQPIVLAFFDVDIESSLESCVKNIWGNLVEGGFIFTDESVFLDYVSLFFSEKWWKDNFNITPPGLIGAGTGLPLGDYYIGPYKEIKEHPSQIASSGAYTYKGSSAIWTYYPKKK